MPKESAQLVKDAVELQIALRELVRIYQFNDRKCICCYDISITQHNALTVLAAKGAVTLNYLANELYLDKSTTSRVIDTLEKKAYVRRVENPDDGRSLKIEVTDKGESLRSCIEDDLIKELRNVLIEIDPDVRQATIRLISRLAKLSSSLLRCQTSCCT